MEIVNFNFIFEFVLKDLQNLLEEKGVCVLVEELLIVQGVVFQFNQVFMNFIGNFMKYVKEGVLLVILIFFVLVFNQEKLVVGLDVGCKFFWIEIKDNGIGFEL